MNGVRPTRKIISFIAGWEGFEPCPYKDAVGVWTIGYGETLNVGPHTPCVTRRQATEQLERRVTRDFFPAVRRHVKRHLWQRESDALTSFVYNVGEGAFASSTLARRLNSKEGRFYRRRKRIYREELRRWTNNGLPGLVRRREAEIKVACQGDYSGHP